VSPARPRVIVLYNAPALPSDHPDALSEADVVSVAHIVSEALVQGGFDAMPFAAAPPADAFVAELARARADLVFNLIEGFGGCSRGEERVTAILELLGLPYTGCPPEAQALCRHKASTKALLRGLGLPTAAFVVAQAGAPLPPLPEPGPWIVKPEAEDASLGLDQSSVVRDPRALSVQVDRSAARYGPTVLIETFLPGAEYNLGILGLPRPQALPIAEVLHAPDPGNWPILTYAAKWHEGSAEDLASPARCPAQVAPDLAERLADLAVRTFEATGCRDYARVDLRLDAEGAPMILEVNPNPALHPSAGWARALRASGRDYEQTLVALARQALERGC
jgi:D-alanine-D-alanine ligase